MTNKILEGMVNAYLEEMGQSGGFEKAMRAALLWLASNVSDEMAEAAEAEHFRIVNDAPETKAIEAEKRTLAAAFRQAEVGWRMYETYFEKLVLSLAVEALDLKRILFDNGFQEAHNRVAEAEAELRKAANLIRQAAGGEG